VTLNRFRRHHDRRWSRGRLRRWQDGHSVVRRTDRNRRKAIKCAGVWIVVMLEYW